MLEFFNQLDQNFDTLARELGWWMYGLVGLNIYAETGLVVAAFLPGDSLLFACGMLCAREDANLNLGVFIVVLWIASILGNYTNFLIARYVCHKLAGKPGIEGAGEAVGKLWGGRIGKIVRPVDLKKADDFFRKWGLLAVGIARFLPFFRTFIPFVAGLSEMKLGPFMLASAVGGLVWSASLTAVGYFAGSIPWIKDNFSFFILGMFVVGFTPVAIGWIRGRIKQRKANARQM